MARHSFFASAPKPPAVPPHQSTTSYQPYQPYQPQPSQQAHQSHQTYQTYQTQIHHPYQLYQAYQPLPPPSRPAHPTPGHPKSRAAQQNTAVQQQVQYIPYFYQVSPLSPSPRQSLRPGATLASSPSSQPKQTTPAPKRPAPPRLSPLIIPVRKSPPPIHVRPEPPRAVARARAPAPPLHAPVPQKPPAVPAKIPLNNPSADDSDIDFFQFQYPCMLPPSTIPQTETISVVPISPPVDASPRYSLPVLPSQNSGAGSASSSLRRSKPYLQSRRQRMSVRDGNRRRVSNGDKIPLAQPEEDEWTEVMHVDSAYDEDVTPVAGRPETPLEYKAEQAAALHALLGLVLEGKADVAGENHERAVAILEEEVELAARGFRKFSADEYVRELREVMEAFDSPCE